MLYTLQIIADRPRFLQFALKVKPMKKILIVLHGENFPESAMNFISTLNEKSPLFLTALVLPGLPHIENWASYSVASIGNLKDVSAEKNTDTFRKRCKTHHIQFAVHKGTTEPGIPQIVKASRFADLLVASEGLLITDEANTPMEGLRQMMHQAECPVLVVPNEMRTPEQIMIAYDGSESSMFAIKQFTYLFPEFRSIEAIVVHMDKNGASMPYKEHIEQWIKGYFDRYSMVTVNYNAAEYFSAEANPHPVLIVTGSFGRTGMSRWMHPSFADKLVSQYHIPIFSGHRR